MAAKPLLKWAGGTGQRLPALRRFSPLSSACHVVVSNSTAAEIERLYDANDEALAAGLRAHCASARRSVNSHAGRRGPVTEYLMTNIDAR